MHTLKPFAFALSILLLAGILMACAPAAAPAPTLTPTPAATPTPVPSPTPFRAISEAEFTSTALASNLLGDPTTRKFVIYLPPSYPTSEQRYPVVYALHGYTGNQWTMSKFMNKVDQMIQSSELPEMIVVMLDGSNVLGGSMYMSSPTIGDYETYITQELVNWIDHHYRTIAQPNARGITGCSMGGDGAIRLGLRHPDVFSVAAGVSGTYLLEYDPTIKTALVLISTIPENFADFRAQRWQVRSQIASAAATSPNPDKPPFFLDMPFASVNGEIELVPEVIEKFSAIYGRAALDAYLAQPNRLQALMIYHGTWDTIAPKDGARAFSALLTENGVPHEYLEVQGDHCVLDYEPVVRFMAEHLNTE